MKTNTYKVSRRFITIFLLAVSLLITLVGCGNQTEKTASEGSGKKEESQVREIAHAMGKTKIEGTPKKIVTLYQGATDALVAFEMTPVGAVESWLEQPIYHYLKEDIGEVQIVGQETQPNLEEIAKLKPDLIIASKIRHEEVYEQLSEIAPTIVHETVFDYKGTVQLMGEAMNEEAKAKEIISAWEMRVADFQTKVKEKLGDKWPLHVSVVNFREDHARIYLTGFAGSILNELGFKGPKDLSDDSQDILQLTDKESISEMNADVIYLFMEDNEAVKKTYEQWTGHPLWENLDAVTNDEVHQVDEIIWNMGGGITAANLMLDDLYKKFELENE
ncbi:ABC transporter substrate-binding protein [Metabacillus malikii]|uniref:Iron complex transport system substrate-binding protein n=1 Tax=Metabacillus malikii TaxID=1504265 RepID=A0ABT9ZBE5_9BACI|nr:iron-siderophore ABC transporter substrate-binding protein [Metabacillus malikii]MDQ0229587.1 iron complex transport system substrate-binding protein [Metabacillus malikii]